MLNLSSEQAVDGEGGTKTVNNYLSLSPMCSHTELRMLCPLIQLAVGVAVATFTGPLQRVCAAGSQC